MCGAIGLPELLVILAIVMLLFGASRLPQLGKALGETVRNFRKGSGEGGEAVTGSDRKPSGEALNQGREVARLEAAEVDEAELDEERDRVPVEKRNKG